MKILSTRLLPLCGVSAMCVLLLSTTAHGENTYTVPLFHGTHNESGQGFVRILNASNRSGAVSVTAWDDAGSEFGPLTLAIDASAVRHFNSEDLEDGNLSKGLTGSTGRGQGDWRLRLTTDLNLVVLAYVRTADGFLTSIHDTALGQRDTRLARYVYPAWIFNPGSNMRQVSKVRIVNPNGEAQGVTISGLADDGRAGAGQVTVQLGANAARLLSAQELESGQAAGLTGALGDGQGKWKLEVMAERPLTVMSLIRADTGHVTNLSTAPMLLAPANAEEFQARMAGKRAVAGPYSVEFAGTRFTERYNGTVERGTYQYTAVGPRTGLLRMRYNDGTVCPVAVIYDAQESARALSVCDDGEGTDLAWRLTAEDADPEPPDGDDHGNTRSSATVVALPSETGGRIDPSTDVDYFRFEVSETREVTAGTPGNNNTWVTLENSEGVELERNTVRDGTNYRTPRRNLSAGTYYVRVDAYQSRTGAYTLRLTAEDADPEPDGDDACSVGLVLSPGDYCTVDIPNISVGTDRFRVTSSGSGCYGGLCGGRSLNLNGFRASRISDTNDWRIDALP